jgi:hypothetical protein
VSKVLAEAILRIGRPIKNSVNFPGQERIRLLTDVSSENCKNFFQNVFIVELGSQGAGVRYIQVGELKGIDDKETFLVDQQRNTSFPIFYPNGGNPLLAQGIYPLPCYLLYDPHIKALGQKEKLETEVLYPRINSTVGYMHRPQGAKEALAAKVAELLTKEAAQYVAEAKQLGILLIYDECLPVFNKLPKKVQDESLLWIAPSVLEPAKHLHLVGAQVLQSIARAKFAEAAELGRAEKAVSTFSNREEEEVVSIYNKSWLWLSPTWEMPRSIYWEDDDWVRGIKIDAENYEAYLYGVQFLKELQVPISSGILKEMFAPITSAEAKKNMRATSFEPIYGIPMVLPLLDGDSEQLFQKYRRMLKKTAHLSDSDLHLEILAGLKGSILPESSDEHRLTIIYYSGDLSRGNMHIRAVIEDVIPSVASRIQKILQRLQVRQLPKIQAVFGFEPQPLYRTENLPSLLGNAFGPGYLWESLQAVLHKEPLRLDRLRVATAWKLNELANKEAYWDMKQELIFYFSFIYFLRQYEELILNKKGGAQELAAWESLLERYHQGTITVDNLKTADHLGFVAGLLLRQYGNSYYQKTKKDFVKSRVMKFGSKLTPEMIWKDGLLRCEELAQQWDMGLAANFRPVLSQALLALLAAQEANQLTAQKDEFLTAFWSGYLIYKKNEQGDEGNESE